MPEVAQKASIAYGDKYLRDNSPASYPYAGAWGSGKLLPQKAPRVPEYKRTSAVNQVEWEVPVLPTSTQENLTDNAEDQVQDLIFRIRTSPSIPHRESLANRLLALFKDAKEEDAASLGISIGSLRSAYNFFQSHANMNPPSISLTPDHNIYASWRVGQNRVFSIHFLPRGDVHFVIFKPNDRHPERQIRVSGTATTDILMETVAPYGGLEWTSE